MWAEQLAPNRLIQRTGIDIGIGLLFVDDAGDKIHVGLPATNSLSGRQKRKQRECGQTDVSSGGKRPALGPQGA